VDSETFSARIVQVHSSSRYPRKEKVLLAMSILVLSPLQAQKELNDDDEDKENTIR